MKLPDNVTAMRDFLGRLIEGGLTEKEIVLITRRNPRILLGIS
jgi:hypothetical protein